MDNSNWIRVKDKLPEDRVAVLASCPKHENVFALSYHEVDQTWYDWNSGNTIKYNSDVYGEVEAWMPMPKCFVDPDIPKDGEIGIYYRDEWHRIKILPTGYITQEDVTFPGTLNKSVTDEFYIKSV